MLIVHGSKVRRKPLGFVAGYCCFCGECRAMRAAHVVQYDHLFGVGIGNDRALATETTCTGCGAVFARDRAAYGRVAKTPPADLLELITETAPGLLEFSVAVAERELRLNAGTLTDEDRRRVVADAVAGTLYLVRTRSKSDFHQSISAVMALLAIISGAAACFFLFMTSPIPWAYAAGPTAAAVVLIPWVILRHLTEERSAARRHGLPLIARALARFVPSGADVDAAMDGLRQRKHPTAKWYTSDQIIAATVDAATGATER